MAAASLIHGTTVSDAGWIGQWSPGAGDPTVAGWLTVVLYLVAAWAAQRTARVSRACRMVARERLFWLLLAVLLGLLGVNKQLDLQTALTEFGRIVAREHGWYEERRVVQLVVVGALGLGAVVISVGLIRSLRAAPMPTHVAIAGVVLLGLFVVVRASSFHHMDMLIRHRWLGLKLNWILEIGGIMTVIIGAQWRRGAWRVARSSHRRR